MCTNEKHVLRTHTAKFKPTEAPCWLLVEKVVLCPTDIVASQLQSAATQLRWGAASTDACRYMRAGGWVCVCVHECTCVLVGMYAFLCAAIASASSNTTTTTTTTTHSSGRSTCIHRQAACHTPLPPSPTKTTTRGVSQLMLAGTATHHTK